VGRRKGGQKKNKQKRNRATNNNKKLLTFRRAGKGDADDASLVLLNITAAPTPARP